MERGSRTSLDRIDWLDIGAAGMARLGRNRRTDQGAGFLARTRAVTARGWFFRANSERAVGGDYEPARWRVSTRTRLLVQCQRGTGYLRRHSARRASYHWRIPHPPSGRRHIQLSFRVTRRELYAAGLRSFSPRRRAPG